MVLWKKYGGLTITCTAARSPAALKEAYFEK